MYSPRRQPSARFLLGGLAALALILVATACAPLPPGQRRGHGEGSPPPVALPPAGHHEVASWSLSELVAADGSALVLRAADRTVAILPARVLKALQAAAQRVTTVANLEPPVISPDFRVIEGNAANAYAIVTPGPPLIAVNLGMIALLLDDEAMWATVLGHELAHLKSRHQQQRAARNQWGEAASGLLSVVLGFAGLPLAPLLTDGAASLVNLGYSRDDELVADALAVAYLRQAGYDPTAALRFHERLATRSADLSGGLLSTHPGGAERIAAIRRQLAPPTR